MNVLKIFETIFEIFKYFYSWLFIETTLTAELHETMQ